MSKMGRPVVDKPKNVKFTIAIDEITDKAIRARVEETGATKAEIVRRALKAYLGINAK